MCYRLHFTEEKRTDEEKWRGWWLQRQHPGVLEPRALSITPRSKALWGTSRIAVYFRGWQISWTWMKPGRRAPQKLKDIGVPLLVSGEKGKLSWDSTETQGGERRKTVPQRNWAIGSSAGTRQKLPERRVLQVKPLSEAGQGPIANSLRMLQCLKSLKVSNSKSVVRGPLLWRSCNRLRMDTKRTSFP